MRSSSWLRTAARSPELRPRWQTSTIAFSCPTASNQTYPNKGTTDFHTQLNAAIAAGADDLIGGGHFQDGQAIVSQLSSVNWKPKIVSLLVAVTEPSFQSGLGAAANNVTGPSQWESAVN